MTTNEILKQLKDSLLRMVAILQLDPHCQWISKFESDLAECIRLDNSGYSASDLGSLSASITHVFQGMGSFNDYSPSIYDPTTGRYFIVPGSEDFEAVAKMVFDLASKLRMAQ